MTPTTLAFKLTPQPPMLRDRVVDLLRKAILAGEFKPGDRIIERQLCTAIGVSRTSVREALRHIESEGLVTNIPNKGLIVTEVTYEEAEQIYEVREVLEGLAAKMFTERASAEQVTNLEASLNRAEQLVTSGDVSGYYDECTEFSEILFKGCENQIVYDCITKLKARIAFLRSVGMSDVRRHLESLNEFKTMVSAITRRDSAAAKSACEFHVRCAARAALAILKARILHAKETATEI